jgi:hypothetical protein
VLDGVVDVEAHVLRPAAGPFGIEQDTQGAVRPGQADEDDLFAPENFAQAVRSGKLRSGRRRRSRT